MSALLTDYTDLITSEHRDKPKFLALVSLFAQWAVDYRNLMESMPGLFDVDAAIGQQLDFLGQWVGAPRTIVVQSNVIYPVAAPYEVALDDDTYRRFIEAMIVMNRWDGTPDMLVTAFATFWGATGTYTAELDNQDMSILMYITGTEPTPAELAIILQFLLPARASGVLLNGTWISFPGPLFGLDIENHFIAGPDVGCFGTFIPGP
jgi:hypothetical protein